MCSKFDLRTSCGKVVANRSFNVTKNGVKKVKNRSAAELLPVKLVPLQWPHRANLNVCTLKIMRGEAVILTDIGYACLDISRLPIDFGKSSGRSNNSHYLSERIFAAAEEFLKPFTFSVNVLQYEPELRFSIALQHKKMPQELTISSHFDTTLSAFLVGVSPVQEVLQEAVAAA